MILKVQVKQHYGYAHIMMIKMDKIITFSKDKRAISIMIGYILLITSAVVMGAIVYQWLKTYIPQETIECPDGVSVYIAESTCIEEGDDYKLKLTLKNNGRFGTGGYFIHATNDPDQELATVDLTESSLSGYNRPFGGAMVQAYYDNEFAPQNTYQDVFKIEEGIFSVEIIPIRFQTYDNKKRLVSCSGAKIIENIKCGPPECTTLTEIDDCKTGEICFEGNCQRCGNGVDTDPDEECDTGRAGMGDYTDGCSDACQITDCRIDPDCSNSGRCIEGVCKLCGNGNVDNGEDCDGGIPNTLTGCTDECVAEDGYICDPGDNSCD